MCGLAGFSLSPTSTVNARQLGHELLKEIEGRGQMASGYAFDNGEGRVGLYKDAVRGGQLPLKGMPRNTKTAIFHTRQATHGSIHDNENNHPIVTPDGKMALTHNGVIWNEQDIRHGTLKGFDLPVVDSSVIGPLIQYYGLEGLSELSGDVALAWLESGSANILHVARVESNPLAYTWLMDGSFVYASTIRYLMNALEEMGLDYGYIFEMDEGIAYEVEDGVIRNAIQTPKLSAYDWSSWGGSSYRDSVRSVTAGGTATVSTNKGSESAGHGFANVYNDDMDTWEFHEGMDGTFTKEDFGDYEPSEAEAEAFHTAMALLKNEAEKNRDEYYTIDDGGDIKTYQTLDELETDLIWWAGLGKGDDDHYSHQDKKTRWCEYFLDIGSFEMDGETRLSWIDQPDDIYNHEDPKGDGLAYIRDGVSLLMQEVGR